MQPTFTTALLDAAHALPPGLLAADPAERFAVYRNNVVSGLSRALAAGFPAVEAIVGTEFFAAMAAIFVRQSPPASPVLLDYGATLPDFLRDFTPATELPYLADVARLELAYTRAFHATDAHPLAADTLGRLAADRIGGLRVTLHPSLQILRADYPAATIWAMNTGRLPLAEITDWAAQDMLVLRPQYSVDVVILAPGEAAFLTALQAGSTLGEAAAAALDAAATFDLGPALAALFMRGAVIACMDSQEDS
ncbi:DNA-binding domain-containing protein [Ferrovibrio terrae]|uniref:HvfC/BufC N-terminal domain-containing protein n=1 Tax=Ferrovibrio terrae TaxID=2594003 RepID=UPI003137860E